MPGYLFIKLSVTTTELPYKICYVVHSSGTTGDQKSIFVPENCIKPNIVDLRKIFCLVVADVIFISSALTFDASIVQMCLTWSCGATMLLVPSDVLCNPILLFEIMSRNHVSILQCTPSLLLQGELLFVREKLFGKHSSLKVVAFGGEPFPSKTLLRLWISENSKIKIYNIYGTTEVSSWASIYPVDLYGSQNNDDVKRRGEDRDWVPVGQLLTYTKLKLMNNKNELCGDSIGEICIESQERVCFIDDEICSNTPKSIRATGDIGERIGGHIYYCGRTNSNIKRNGLQVSLFLLKKMVETVNDVVSCYCLISKNRESARNSLVLFICCSKKTNRIILESKIISCVKNNLDSSYIPEHVHFIEQMPITSHGKVDDSALLKLLTHYDKPGCNLADIFERTWCTVLNMEQSPKPSDNFVTNGGDSFSAVYLINKIFDSCGNNVINISYEELFQIIIEKTYSQVHSALNRLPALVKSINFKSFSTKIQNTEVKGKPHKHFLSFSRQNNIQGCPCFPSKSNVTLLKSSIQVSVSCKYDMRKCVDASPLVVMEDDHAKKIVYIGSHAHALAAVSSSSLEVLWEITLGDRIESSAMVTADGNYICVGCYDGLFYVLHRETGKHYWKFKTNDAIKSTPSIDYKTGIVVFGSHDKHVYALDFASKSCLWKVFFGSSCFSSPLIHDNNVYVCLLSGSISSLALLTGEKNWTVSINKPLFSSPCMCETFFCVGCVDNCLYAISLTGHIIWKYQTNGPVFSSPLYFRDDLHEYVIFGSNDKFVYCVNCVGNLIWKYEAEASVYASCSLFSCQLLNVDNSKICEKTLTNVKIETKQIISLPSSSLQSKTKYLCEEDFRNGDKSNLKCTLPQENFIVYAATNGSLGLLNLHTGTHEASFQLPHQIFSSPVVCNNKIFVGCRDNFLYCLTLQSCV